jgi:copper oxidase (laccase) domain-containing protein
MNIDSFVSTVMDGSMKSPDRNFATVLPIRQAFLMEHAIEPNDTTLIQVTYEGNDFRRYIAVDHKDRGDGITRAPSIEADALITTESDHALFLPLADCIGAVIYEPNQHILMMSHLGRHNLEQNGGFESIQYITTRYNIDPKTLQIWLSPAADAGTYPLFAFDNRSLHDVAVEQLMSAGILRDNIDVSPIDSASDSNYFSHSQFLAGNRETDGRHAIVAVMR